MDWSAEALYSSTIQAPRRTMALVSRVEKYVEGASTRSWWRQLLRTVVDFRALAHPPIYIYIYIYIPSPSLTIFPGATGSSKEYNILFSRRFSNRDDNPRFIRDDERSLEEEKSTE